MFIEDSRIGRLLSGLPPINKPGYYLVCEEGQIRYSAEKPHSVQIIDADTFIDTLVQGCREAIRIFADSPDNREVYVFCLRTSEFKESIVYLNTVAKYEETLTHYHNKYGTYPAGSQNAQHLKYSLGEFPLQFWNEEMGDAGRILAHFRDLMDYPSFLEEDILWGESDIPLIAFETGILARGYYLLFSEAMQRLHAEHAFDSLDRTADFIAYTSIGNSHLDYSIVMRSTIDPDLFYKLFPDILAKDQMFAAEISKNSGLNAGEYLDYWLAAVHDNYSREFPYSAGRTAYDVYMQMSLLGSSLADEALKRLSFFIITVSTSPTLPEHCPGRSAYSSRSPLCSSYPLRHTKRPRNDSLMEPVPGLGYKLVFSVIAGHRSYDIDKPLCGSNDCGRSPVSSAAAAFSTLRRRQRISTSTPRSSSSVIMEQ